MNPIWHITKEQSLEVVAKSVRSALEKFLSGGDVIIEFKRKSKTREQEKKYHAMIRDIARTIRLDVDIFIEEFSQYMDETEAEIMALRVTKVLSTRNPKLYKALFIHQFAQEMREQGTPLRSDQQNIVSLDGKGMITVRPSSTEFRVSEGEAFIEYLYAKAAQYNAIIYER